VPIVVQKFGGTSVADASRIMNAARRAIAAKRAGNQVVVVVSARGDKTDELIELANSITDNPPAREMDMLLSTGEQESVALLAMAVQKLGEPAISFTGYQIGILTDSTYTKARIKKISTDRMKKALDAGQIVIAAGFQGIDDDFNITTLGRGGSDTTATALAAVLEADVCQILTDVDGIYTTDPRIVKEARKLERISYDELLELTSLGGGKLHSRSVEFAKKYNVHLAVVSSFEDKPGTLIAPEGESELSVVTGLAIVKNEARVSLVEIPDRPGVMSLIFSKMADRKIPIDMVVQDVGSGGLAEVSFTVPEGDLAATLTAAEEAVTELGAGKVMHGTNLSKVSAVGAGMRTHTGVAAQMFKTLADAGVNIGMITTSEIKISVQVRREQVSDALQSIHRAFALEKPVPAALEVGHVARTAGDVATKKATRAELERDVVARLSSMEDIVVSEVDLDTNQARITIRQLPDQVGIAAVLFGAVAEGGIMVDMIVQNVGHDGRTNLSFTIPSADVNQCLLLVREVLEPWPSAELTHDRHIAKLSVKGIGLRTHTGVGQKMFQALAAANVNVQIINTSEIQISAVVAADSGPTAHQALVKAFGLKK
jgi:aspartate kinase